jgi:hypothetical protein
MPLLNYQLFIFFRKFFSFGQFAELETLRLAQFHLVFHLEHRFAAAVTDVDVNRAMLVAVKEKSESVLFENGWHGGNYVVGSNANVGTDNARAAADEKIHGQTLTITRQGVECAGNLPLDVRHAGNNLNPCLQTNKPYRN